MVPFDSILSLRDERGLGFLWGEGNLPSLAPGGYALQYLVDTDDSAVVLTPLTGECESTIVCIYYNFRDRLKEVIGPSTLLWGTLALKGCSQVYPLTHHTESCHGSSFGVGVAGYHKSPDFFA